MPLYKWCWCCKQSKHIAEFGKNASKGDGYSTECRSCKSAYGKTDNAKLTQRRYLQSEGGKITVRLWNQSEKGKISALKRRFKYRETPWGYAMNRERDEAYGLSGKKLQSAKRRYYEKQDEAGCHQNPQTFYPAYRFLKTLINAPVVEAKV